MRANEIIRGVLNLIDQIDCGVIASAPVSMAAPVPQHTTINITAAPVAKEPVAAIVEPEIPADEESRRFRQIIDILDKHNRPTMYDNSPNETIAGINSVTTDAGLQGVHPEDIRADSAAMYPRTTQ
jgi:hypothetical protein